MRSVIARVAILGLALAAVGARAQQPHPSVCRVAVQERGGQAFGSGTLIDARGEYGLVVTNWHVVRDATGPIEARFPSGFVSEARALKLDDTWDLAALVVWRPPTEPVPLATRAPAPGDRLTICGYGQGDYLQQTGRCTDYYAPDAGQPLELVELNVQARQGDSGGPILNDRGEVAGVLFGAARGTTLGSFGGRVRAFLATLAPNIGVPTIGGSPGPGPTAIAASPSQPPALTPPAAFPPVQFGRDAALIAPFLAAAAPRVGPFPPPAAPQPTHSLAPVRTLADRSAAPAPVKTRHAAAGWVAPPTRPAPAVPTVAAAAPATLPEGAIDWSADGQTALALAGAAALFTALVRMTS